MNITDICNDCERVMPIVHDDDEDGLGPLCADCAVCVHNLPFEADCAACLLEHAVYGDEGAPREALDLAWHLNIPV